ncbi:MAG: urea carboxylase-associated family protein, partial [Candidatus Caldarchaeum sp.]
MKVVFDKVVPARSGVALVVKKGQFVRVAEVEGGQIVDFVVLNADNTRERFSQARTKANQGKIYVTKGDKLYSRFNTVMMTITE